ncbi:MAG: hypothetical protein HIU57_02210 [Acidobacteria bacterium]|nr:hypothetical protein [Acidobacteriota bacterium]
MATAALSHTEATTRRLGPDDAFWTRLHEHFSQGELVELACFIALAMGQQRGMRPRNIDHHQVMADTFVATAPGGHAALKAQRGASAPGNPSRPAR